MSRQIITAKNIAQPASSTTVHGVLLEGSKILFVTGQVAYDADLDPWTAPDEAHGWGGIEEQTVRVMDYLSAILAEAGATFENVAKRNVYLNHRSDFEPAYRVMERYFTKPVASTGVISNLVPAGARIEVDLVAILP